MCVRIFVPLPWCFQETNSGYDTYISHMAPLKPGYFIRHRQYVYINLGNSLLDVIVDSCVTSASQYHISQLRRPLNNSPVYLYIVLQIDGIFSYFPYDNLACTLYTLYHDYGQGNTNTSHMFLSSANHIQDQYIFIHDAMLESLICGDTELDAGNFRASLDNLLLKDLSGRTEMDRQFAVSTLQYKLFHKVMNFAILQILGQVCPNTSGAQRVASKKTTANNMSEEFLPGK